MCAVGFATHSTYVLLISIISPAAETQCFDLGSESRAARSAFDLLKTSHVVSAVLLLGLLLLLVMVVVLNGSAVRAAATASAGAAWLLGLASALCTRAAARLSYIAC